MILLLLLLLLLLVALVCAETHVRAPIHVVDLDKAPAERWSFLNTPRYRVDAKAAAAYFGHYIHGPMADAIEFIAKNVERFFGGELADEMAGAAKALDIDEGLLVMLNVLYELRGFNQSHPDITGGHTPPSGVGLNNKDGLPQRVVPHGACTSIVVGTTNDGVWHARNLDWNLEKEMRNMTFECHFQKGGKTLAHGACFAGYVGLLTGMKAGKFSASIDERDIGGNPIVDGINGFLLGAMPVSHALRHVLLTADSYTAAVDYLTSVHLAAPVYFIVGGVDDTEGTLLSRDRRHNLHPIAFAPPKTFWLLETNYDHWVPAPEIDNRRAWAQHHLRSFGEQSEFERAALANVAAVITTWPVENGNTAQQVFMNAKRGHFEVFAVYNGTAP